MAQELLNNLLSFKTSTTDILEWLTSDDLNKAQWADFNSSCPREEFISFFLDYLREQFVSILQNSNGSKQTPAKKISIQPKKFHVSESIKKKNQRKETDSSLVESPLNCKNDTKKQVKTNTAQQDSTANDQSEFLEKCNLENSNVKSIKSPVAKFHTPEKSILSQNPNSNQAMSSVSPQTSTPIASKNNSSIKKRAELVACNSSEYQNFNPAFKNSVEYEHFNLRREGRNINFDDSSFPSLGGRNSNNSSVSNCSQNFGKDESFDLSHSNLSTRSSISVCNKILQSPESPLYSNSASMLSPINSKAYQNRFHNSPSNNNLNNAMSTPERIPNNLSKSSKTTPRQSLSLSDFITVDTRSSKKCSTKKVQSKSWSKTDEQNDSDPCNVISNTSAMESENKNKRRRKVNPTRLNITDKKGDKENTVFGEVSRPFTQNPHFVNIPPIDKSVDNESFQIERGLVKIERQKKPEIISNLNVVDEQTQPKWKILQRVPNKISIPTSTITPDKTLVENMQILNLLAELYSGFLDHNLVFNPMTELYFIINLITNQYKDNVKSLSITTNVEEKLQQSSDESIENCRYEKKELSALKKSLNFDDLAEKIDWNNDNKINNDNDLQCNNKLPTELGCSTLIDDTKEKLNLINKKLKEIDVNIDQTTSDENDIHKAEVSKELNVTTNCVKLYLNTPHNCVYFSTQVLNLQKDFLKCLDRVTLKLLCENNQISLFQPELCKYLDSVYNIKVSESNTIKSPLNIGIVELNVCFQIDTDNRENFPSSVAFQCFRKQRDMFYEILKIWEDNHLMPGWTFQIALSGKIKTMLMIHSDVTNFTHFTRLFKSQMLISCIQSGQQEDLLDDETLNFLKNIKDMNLEKLTHLKKKLVTPLSQNGPVPLPSFPGFQEFYKDFILCASNCLFFTYLENTFINEIMELNNTQFAGSDIEDTETEVDERTKQSFVICLSSLRLLAKFLGFLTSLPYRSETSMLEDVIASQVALRSKCLPHIDLRYCLYNAVIQGKLSLTIPWIVEYLSMMDHASLRLPYYKKVLEMLYCIYRASNYHTDTNSDELMSQQTAVLVKLCIGWLFELPIFPTDLYYSWQAKFNNKALKVMCEKQPTSVDAEDSVISVKHSLFLDKLEMIDNRILYSCCPFLRELNILLTPGNSSVNNSTSHRHVTPVTSQLQKPMKKVNTKHLEIQLEEAFFHGQPMSTRKTVEYVSERIASSCVKYIYNNLLPVERRKNSAELKRLVEERCSDTVNQNPEVLKNFLLKDMNALSMNNSKNIKEKCDEIIPKMCESRVNQSIESLLADDCLKPVKDMCVKIATRMAMERIDQWIQSHIIGGSTFMKYMELELNKIMKANDDVIIEKKCHNVNAASPTNILDGLREIIWNLMETRGRFVTKEILIKFLDQSYMCLTERCDLKVASEKVIASLIVDLCLFLISYRHDLFIKEVQDKVFHIWKMDSLKMSESDSPLSRILNPRNIMLMSQSLDGTVWLSFGKFLNNILKENILTIDTLSEQAIALFRRDWPETISKNLSVCLGQAIADYRSTDEETERIRYLLRWVAGVCSDVDREGFSLD